MLINSEFSQLAGARVGLITNPAAVVNGIHVIGIPSLFLLLIIVV